MTENSLLDFQKAGTPVGASDTPASKGQRSWGVRPVGPRGEEGRQVWEAAVWAPQAHEVRLVLEGQPLLMRRGPDGVHRLEFKARAGAAYGFDLGKGPRPDPAAREQVGDVHGLSRLADEAFDWPATEASWRGRDWAEAVILELHIGLFTPEGTFEAAARRLPELAALGITGVEIMPVNQFPGRRGWGYDTVLPFAVHPAYGGAAQFKAFVAAAHAAGIAAILDVVYNHFGPDGAYLHEFAPDFFDLGAASPWGARIRYTLPQVRAFYLENVAMWIGEFHLDGLRIDASHEVQDPSTPHLLAEIAETARSAGQGRQLWLVLEDERNLPGPFGSAGALYDAQWNDDFHHAIHVLLTDEKEGYYEDFAEDPLADLIRALAEGQIGEAPDAALLPPTAFVNANQTHDQVGNRALGERLITLAGPEATRVAHALLLLSPYIPLLFMGEEAGETAPFLYFVDMDEGLARLIDEGRRQEFGGFEGYAAALPNASDPESYERSRPYRGDPAEAQAWRDLTRELLRLRQRKVVPLIRTERIGRPEVTRCGPRSLTARWRFAAGELTLSANLGALPDAAPEEPWDFRFGDLARDRWAIGFRATGDRA